MNTNFYTFTEGFGVLPDSFHEEFGIIPNYTEWSSEDTYDDCISLDIASLQKRKLHVGGLLAKLGPNPNEAIDLKAQYAAMIRDADKRLDVLQDLKLRRKFRASLSKPKTS
jgi:hypothetical protein